jgi:tetratricopeptide (TPR) repeat protein
LLKEVLEVRTSRHGADHADTLNAKLDLAATYRRQGDFAVAEALFKEVLASRTRTLGAGHADVLDAQYRLAVLYQARGDLAAAEALLKEVLARRADTLGPNHFDTLETQHALGAVYEAQGRNALAETLYKQVLARRTAAFGPGHPITLDVRYNLANLYHWKLRNHELAEPLYVEALATATALYGAEGATTLDVKLMLAQLYRNRGRFAEAEATFRDVLEVRTATLGADHADTLYTRFELAILYRWMKKVELAIPWTEQTLELAKATRHPATLRMQAHLGGLYCDSGRFSDAVPLLEEVRRKGAGDGELDWVGDALLTAYLGAGDAERALALATEQARVARERFPADSPELAAALAPPAEALVRLRAYADAEPLLLVAHEGLSQPRAEAAPRADAELRDAISRLVSLYDAWGKPEEAAKWREELARR